MFSFLSQKIKTCWIYKNNVFANWEKCKVSCNFYLVCVIDFYTVTSIPMGFHRERAVAGLGPTLMQKSFWW